MSRNPDLPELDPDAEETDPNGEVAEDGETPVDHDDVDGSYEPASVDPLSAPAAGLYLVATPIGNLEDMTYRAVRILKAADLILAEDTRHSRVLLSHYGISRPSESYNDFNKEKRTPGYVDRLKNGERLALICDAGTPGIADPAFNLVKAALAEGVKVFPIPGPCAMVAAVTASGLPTDRFAFENFPPKKSAQRLRNSKP
jgi:16S rRNA (cytidine1402-2'-O)-methyltransferase